MGISLTNDCVIFFQNHEKMSRLEKYKCQKYNSLYNPWFKSFSRLNSAVFFKVSENLNSFFEAIVI